METLGERLSTERRKAGKSVVDVEASTNIRCGLIEALENGDYARLPSPVYVRGYIRSYAKFLELPAEPFLRLYEEETGETQAPSPVGELPADQVVPRREQAHALPMRTAAVIAALVAGLALAVWGASRALSGPGEPPPVPPKADGGAPAVPTSTPLPADTPVSPAPSAQATEPAEGEDGGFTLTIEVARGSASWMLVTLDGERVHVGTVRGPETLKWEVSEEARVSQIGKPSALTIKRDGEPVAIPPSAGVPEVTLRAGG
ncbi:MAG: helix-turn-helix domain-containing protein [Coriobacteriia bacterium]|nr:helix-turn-helix domain-containing protein [Coriobacteriia bacterium]